MKEHRMRIFAAACVSLWIGIVPAAAQLQSTPPAAAGNGPASPQSIRVPEEKRQCPATRTLDCMPLSAASQQGLCKKDYLAWIKSHCPGTDVVY